MVVQPARVGLRRWWAGPYRLGMRSTCIRVGPGKASAQSSRGIARNTTQHNISVSGDSHDLVWLDGIQCKLTRLLSQKPQQLTSYIGRINSQRQRAWTGCYLQHQRGRLHRGPRLDPDRPDPTPGTIFCRRGMSGCHRRSGGHNPRGRIRVALAGRVYRVHHGDDLLSTAEHQRLAAHRRRTGSVQTAWNRRHGRRVSYRHLCDRVHLSSRRSNVSRRGTGRERRADRAATGGSMCHRGVRVCSVRVHPVRHELDSRIATAGRRNR